MANPFDQFDGEQSAQAAAKPVDSENPFDKFDHQTDSHDSNEYSTSDFMRDAAHHAGRLIALAAKGANDSIINTLAIPGNATTELINKFSGRSDPTLSEMWKGQSDKMVPPPQDLVEQTANVGGGFVAGSKIPLPGNAPAATGQLADSIAAARGQGYVLPKSAITGKVGVVEQLLGAKALATDATQRNLKQMSDNVAAQFKLPKGTEITHDTMDAVRNVAGKAYEAISSLSPAYAATIEKIKSLRSDAQGYYRQVSANYDHDVAKKADSLWNEAQTLDGQLANNLKIDKASNPDLYANYMDARRTIAQTHDVDKAIVDSRGQMNPTKFSQMYGKEKPLSGSLLGAGRSAQAFKKAFTTTGGHPLSMTDAAIAGSGAGLGYFAAHDPKLIAMALAGGVGRYGLRKLALSGPVQDMRLSSPAQKINAIAQALMVAGVAGNGSDQQGVQ